MSHNKNMKSACDFTERGSAGIWMSRLLSGSGGSPRYRLFQPQLKDFLNALRGPIGDFLGFLWRKRYPGVPRCLCEAALWYSYLDEHSIKKCFLLQIHFGLDLYSSRTSTKFSLCSFLWNDFG